MAAVGTIRMGPKRATLAAVVAKGSKQVQTRSSLTIRWPVPGRSRRLNVRATTHLNDGFLAEPCPSSRARVSFKVARRASDCSRPRPCENAKALGFRVSLYPSQGTTKPIQRDLKGVGQSRVFWQNLLESVVMERRLVKIGEAAAML